MKRQTQKAEKLDTREIIDRNSRLIDALKNLSDKISCVEMRKRLLSHLPAVDEGPEDVAGVK